MQLSKKVTSIKSDMRAEVSWVTVAIISSTLLLMTYWIRLMQQRRLDWVWKPSEFGIQWVAERNRWPSMLQERMDVGS